MQGNFLSDYIDEKEQQLESMVFLCQDIKKEIEELKRIETIYNQKTNRGLKQ